MDSRVSMMISDVAVALDILESEPWCDEVLKQWGSDNPDFKQFNKENTFTNFQISYSFSSKKGCMYNEYLVS